MKLSHDLKEFIGLLNFNNVEFLIVGAHALAWHGLPRYTKDIDFLIHVSKENAELITDCLAEFGFASLGLTPQDFLIPDQVIQIGGEPHRIDLLTGITGVGWDEAWASRTAGDLDGLPVQYLGINCFIKNKLAAGRPQDIADVCRLREITD